MNRILFPLRNDWIQLEFGAPDATLLPTDMIQRAVDQRMRQDDAWIALQYGPQLGDAVFRNALADFLSSPLAYASPVLPSHLCVSNGASQSLANLMNLFAQLDETIV
ncbi:hypothetical protein HDU91_005067, partial [Kappamyces sp. JEL0680]